MIENAFNFKLTKKSIWDKIQSIIWPLMKPINGATTHQSWKLCNCWSETVWKRLNWLQSSEYQKFSVWWNGAFYTWTYLRVDSLQIWYANFLSSFWQTDWIIEVHFHPFVRICPIVSQDYWKYQHGKIWMKLIFFS